MRLETVTHEETVNHYPDLAPDYQTVETVSEYFVHPENTDEKQRVFDLIVSHRTSAYKFVDGLDIIKAKYKRSLQQKWDEKNNYAEKLRNYKSKQGSWWYRNFVGQPYHEEVGSFEMNMFNAKIQPIMDAANYIIDMKEIELFYTPMGKALYETIMDFDDIVKGHFT